MEPSEVADARNAYIRFAPTNDPYVIVSQDATVPLQLAPADPPGNLANRPQRPPVPRPAAPRPADQDSYDPSVYIYWRVWLGIVGSASLIIGGFNIYALACDWAAPCDVRLKNYAVANLVVLVVQLAFAVSLFVILPSDNQNWTSDVYQRFLWCRILLICSGVSMLLQVSMVPAGLVIYKYSEDNCQVYVDDNGTISYPGPLYSFVFWLVTVEAGVFVLLSLPLLITPCFMVLYEEPRHHGITNSQLDQLPQMTYRGEQDLADSTTESANDKSVSDAALAAAQSVPLPNPATSTTTAESTSVPPAAEPSVPEANANAASSSSASQPQSEVGVGSSSSAPGFVLSSKKGQFKLPIHFCVICHEDWSLGAQVNLLSCNHAFHKECLKTWLFDHSHCPFCRTEINFNKKKR